MLMVEDRGGDDAIAKDLEPGMRHTDDESRRRVAVFPTGELIDSTVACSPTFRRCRHERRGLVWRFPVQPAGRKGRRER